MRSGMRSWSKCWVFSISRKSSSRTGPRGFALSEFSSSAMIRPRCEDMGGWVPPATWCSSPPFPVSCPLPCCGEPALDSLVVCSDISDLPISFQRFRSYRFPARLKKVQLSLQAGHDEDMLPPRYDAAYLTLCAFPERMFIRAAWPDEPGFQPRAFLQVRQNVPHAM